MRARELAWLCLRLRQCCHYTNSSTRTLEAIRESLLYASDKKIDKTGERYVKQMLYTIEYMLRATEDYLDSDQYSESDKESMRSSMIVEMRRIIRTQELHSIREKSLVSRETMVGREFHNQKEKLIESLLDSNSSPRVIILGKPGSGKTTFIWDALHDSRVQNYFHQVLTQNFNPDSPYFMPNDYQKCLAVVDDRSNVDVIKSLLSVDEQNLLNLNFFKSNEKGCKIVIISSLDLDLEHIGPSEISLRMPSLDEDESWDLFQKLAFRFTQRPQSTLLDIRHEICQRCGNNPGVINIVATILSSKSTAEESEHFLNVVMTSVPDPIATISSTIEFTKMFNGDKSNWGYYFAWCSLLPKDYQFRKDHLFHLWRAHEDFTEYFEEITSITEDQLDDCFNEFLRKGYFLECDTIGSIVSYKINHLVFELMKYVAGDDFCFVDKTTPEPNYHIIRHASLVVDPSWKPPSWLYMANNLQSLLLWPSNAAFCFSLSKIGMTLAFMTQLRTFYSEVGHCELYPAFVDNFKRLKNLRLRVVSSISLPNDIPALLKLLKIDIRYISTKTLAPNSVDSLTDGNFGEEERLALLIKFTTFKKMTVKYESCNELNIEQINKILESLNLLSASFDEDVWRLASLNPHQSLESLVVCQWKGETLPAWVIDEFSVFLRSLLSIQIANCAGCQHLPGFNTLPLLSSLQLGSLPSLMDITISGHDSEACSKNSVYPSLKCLVLCDLPELMGWLSKESDHNIQQYYFPVLTEVRVQGCPKLMLMPSVPKLESLGAINIEVKTLNNLMFPPTIDPSLNVDSQELIETSEEILSHIKYLEIDGCKEIKWGDKPNGSEKGDWHAIKSIHSLKLTDIPELISLPRNLECFMTLKQLSLCWLVNLKVLPEWIGQFIHLRQLTIHYCPKLTKLPKSDGSFSALEQLEIRYCPRVSQFPESLPNLKILQVQEFGRLDQILRVSQNLEELEINNCDELEWETPSVEGEVSVNVWESLNSLHSLKFTKMDRFPKDLDFAKLSKLCRLVIEKCPKLSNIPESLCSLSTLEHLQIHYCPGLRNIPHNFKNLGSVQKLEIRVSPQLEKRCKPDGEDWSVIQHIPNIVINDSPQQNAAEQHSVA